MLGSNVVLKEHAETRHSVIDANTYVGASSKVLGTIVGKNCDIKSGVTLNDGAALGDECVIGEGASIAPDVKVYPFKIVESGAQINSSIIWESRGTSQLFGKEGVVGIINVDITAELALKLAMAYGTTLPKGARVTTSRDAHPASRVFKRALICGLNSTGVVVRDLRVASAAINRFEVKNGNTQGGMHVRISPWDPEMVQIQVFEPPGVSISEKRQKDIEKYYGRQDFRRAFYSEFGEIQFPDRAMETYLRGLTRSWDVERIRNRAYRLVIDYSYSAASLILPNILGSLNAEILSLRAFSDERHTAIGAEDVSAHIAEVRRLVDVMSADMGLVISPGGERLFVIDERGEEVPVEKALLLFVQARRAAGGQGSEDRRAADGDPTRRVSRRALRRRDRAQQGLDAGVHASGVRGGRRVRRRAGWRLRLSAVPARLRRRHEPRQAARAAGAAGAHAERAGRRDPVEHDRAPHGPLRVVAQGHRHARDDRAPAASDRRRGRESRGVGRRRRGRRRR